MFVEANSCWYQASRPMSTGTLKLAPAAWSPGERGYLRSGWLVSVWTRRTVFALGRGREPLVPGRLCDPWFLGIFGGVRGCIRSPTELALQPVQGVASEAAHSAPGSRSGHVPGHVPDPVRAGKQLGEYGTKLARRTEVPPACQLRDGARRSSNARCRLTSPGFRMHRPPDLGKRRPVKDSGQRSTLKHPTPSALS